MRLAVPRVVAGDLVLAVRRLTANRCCEKR